MLTLDPNSEDGKEFTRLMASDLSREVLEDHFDCALGFYNGFKGVAAPTRDALKKSVPQARSRHFWRPGFAKSH